MKKTPLSLCPPAHEPPSPSLRSFMTGLRLPFAQIVFILPSVLTALGAQALWDNAALANLIFIVMYLGLILLFMRATR